MANQALGLFVKNRVKYNAIFFNVIIGLRKSLTFPVTLKNELIGGKRPLHSLGDWEPW